MVPWLEPITPSAPYSALVMHIDVSTLPATTAAGYRGFSIEPSGMMICNGLRQPLLSGISSSTRVRNTYRTAAMHTDEGALRSEEHTSELQSLMRIPYAVFCLNKKKQK